MPRAKNSRHGAAITHPGYEYSCANCGGKVTKKPCMAVKEKKEKQDAAGAAKPKMSGLHGWRCENCGSKKRFSSVIRDISGGKEADKSFRESGFTVSRPLKVLRVLKQEEKQDGTQSV